MRSGLISISFEVPSESEFDEGHVAHICVNPLDLLEEFEEAASPAGKAELIQKQRMANDVILLQDLLEEEISSWVAEDQPERCERIALYLEGIAENLRHKGETLSKNFRPRPSQGPRF